MSNAISMYALKDISDTGRKRDVNMMYYSSSMVRKHTYSELCFTGFSEPFLVTYSNRITFPLLNVFGNYDI